jgi:hypothetical protein
MHVCFLQAVAFGSKFTVMTHRFSVLLAVMAIALLGSTAGAGGATTNQSTQAKKLAAAICTKAIKGKTVISTAVFARCKAGLPFTPKPCPGGQPNILTTATHPAYVLRVGQKAAKLSKSPTKAQVAKACATSIVTAPMNAGAQYLAIVAPVNQAIRAFEIVSGQWTSSISDTQAEADAAPLIAAMQMADQQFTDDKWPADEQSDIRGVVSADADLMADLESLSTVDDLNSSSLTTAIARDEASLVIAVGFARHDLGLPPAPTS